MLLLDQRTKGLKEGAKLSVMMTTLNSRSLWPKFDMSDENVEERHVKRRRKLQMPLASEVVG